MTCGAQPPELTSSSATRPQAVLTAADVGVVESLMDDVFRRFERLSSSKGVRIGEVSAAEDGEIREVNRATAFQRSLKRTCVFRVCRSIARTIVGRWASYAFDHAIYKEPHTGSVLWHQDQAYKTTIPHMRSIHFWIPLQNVNLQNGCMQFISKSHLGPCLPHRRAANSHSLFLESVDTTNAVTYEMQVGDVGY